MNRLMDTELEERLRKGDERVFRAIYDEYYLILCRFANQLLEDAAQAEEVVDDVIFYLWEHRQEVKILYSMRAYLFRAVRNRCLNELHSPKFQQEHNLSFFLRTENLELLDSLFIDDSQPLDMLIEQELEEELYRSIEALPDECRTVFRKSRFEQKKYEEISEEMGISVNTVKYHIKKALAFLKTRLGKYLQVLIIYLLS